VALHSDFGFRRVKLPGGFLGIADGDPGMLDDVDLFGEAIDFLGFEIERIFGDKKARIGAALQLQEPADFFKSATASGNVVVGFVGFEMLRFKIEDDVAAGEDLGSGVIVLDVIGAEAHATVGDVHVVVGDVQTADSALRTARGDFGDAAGGRLDGNLLRKNGEGQEREEESGQAQA